jgi:hypothetical protein
MCNVKLLQLHDELVEWLRNIPDSTEECRGRRQFMGCIISKIDNMLEDEPWGGDCERRKERTESTNTMFY